MTLGTNPDAYGPLKPDWISQVALGLSVLAAVLIVQRLIKHVLREWRSSENSVTSDLLQSIISIALYMVAALLYLSLGLGVNISSVLATSAILSVIVGLALQPTLGNLFAGVSIEIERPLRVGDFVRWDTVEGQVVSLNWRSVNIQTERGSRVVMPNNELNSRLLEVIPADHPYRHEVEFSMGNELPPGQVIRSAMQVMCSGLPGICTSPSPTVVLLGNDTATGMLKYGARFYTLRFLDRKGIASSLLERLWYFVSREKLPINPWGPDIHVQLSARQGQQDNDAIIAALGKPASHEHAFQRHHLAELIETAFAGVGLGLRGLLLSSATTLRYGNFERCDRNAVALVLKGNLIEERAISKQQEDVRFQALMNQLICPTFITGNRRMSIATYQSLLHEATLAIGPLAHDLCKRVASLTADPYLAYQAVAQSIPSPLEREHFLTSSPRQTNREIGFGKWIGWASVLDLEATLPPSRAVNDCTLLVWTPATLRLTLSTASPEDLESLAIVLKINVPGCEELTTSRLLAWLA